MYVIIYFSLVHSRLIKYCCKLVSSGFERNQSFFLFAIFICHPFEPLPPSPSPFLEIMTDRPTNRPIDRRTDRALRKFHLNNIIVYTPCCMLTYFLIHFDSKSLPFIPYPFTNFLLQL